MRFSQRGALGAEDFVALIQSRNSLAMRFES